MSESDLELYSIVGKMLREIRESKGYTLEVAAEYLSIAPKSLQRYECGERKIKMGTIKSLCEFYAVDYEQFIREAKTNFTESEDDLSDRYYFNDETAKAAQEIFENKELRMLFDVTRDSDAADLRALHSMALALKRKERGNGDDAGC